MRIRAWRRFKDIDGFYYPNWVLEKLAEAGEGPALVTFIKMVQAFEEKNPDGIKLKQKEMAKVLGMGITAFHDHYHKLLDIGALTQIMRGSSNNQGSITYLNRIPRENDEIKD